MKKAFIIIGVILCIVAYPFRSMLIEGVTATIGPIEDVREGGCDFSDFAIATIPFDKNGYTFYDYALWCGGYERWETIRA